MATAPVMMAPEIFPDAMLIDGQTVAGVGAALIVLNPANGAAIISFPGASEAQFREAITAARRTADNGNWANLPAVERVAIVSRFVTELERREGELRRIIVAETGCPVGSPVMDAQLGSPLLHVRGLLDLYLKLPDIEENPLPLDQRINPAGIVLQSVRRHVPVGVVAAISAYNFPFFLNLWKVVPALVTGNSVILRPSPLTPLSALALAEAAIAAGIPAGVLGIVAESGAEGALLLTTDPAVDMVSFTGSTDVGRKVMEQGASTMKRLQLELGGKSAQIFLPDKVEAAYGAAASVCFAHAGQGCVLGTRVLVPDADKGRVLDEMKARFADVRIGDPSDPATVMGPLISAAQVERCERYVRLAVEAGATVVTGGKRLDGPGFFFEPTVLDVPDNTNPAARDEIFGPIVAVIGYRDIDHAVAMANDSIFGLSGYVHGKDARAALAVAQRIRSGTVNVNLGGAMSGYASSGGHKLSGLGRERGVEGLRAYQEIQCLNFAS